jgi:membrane fusion protein, multidrug efflux system
MKNIFISIVLTLVLASCGGKQETENAQLETDISPVVPKINGSVSKIFIQDNQIVKEGDTLVVLDDANYRIAVQQAEIGVLSARQNVELSKSGRGVVSSSVNSVSANMYAANASVEAAKVKFNVSLKNYERFKTLLEQKSATQQQFDGIKAEKEAAEQLLKIAEGQVIALQSQITTSQANVSTSDNGISLAELAVKQAETNLAAAKLQLSYCSILAPASGVISKKNVQKGQVVAIGQPLMAVTNNQKIWVIANFKETQVADIKVGQEAEIKIDAYDDKTFTGKVESFSQATGAKFSLLPADNATGNFVKVTQRIPVKVVFTDKNNISLLRAGMSALVIIKTK